MAAELADSRAIMRILSVDEKVSFPCLDRRQTKVFTVWTRLVEQPEAARISIPSIVVAPPILEDFDTMSKQADLKV